jgi:hypothetical protein
VDRVKQLALRIVGKFQGGKIVPPLLTTLVMNYELNDKEKQLVLMRFLDKKCVKCLLEMLEMLNTS